MRIFVDTSSLFKKYMEESGSEAFGKLLTDATEIAVSPVTWIEINAIVERCFRGRLLSREQAEQLRIEIKKDFFYFGRMLWNENLEAKAVEVVRSYALKALDAIQLASGILSEAELFVTSDQKLYKEAKKIIRHTKFI